MASISKRVSGAWQNTSYGIRATATDTITTLPTTIYSDGTNVTVNIKGNTVQSNTPTPSSPVDVLGVGELETSGEHSGKYKIPISSGGATTPVYLGEVQTTRNVKKLVLTGDTPITNYAGGSTGIGFSVQGIGMLGSRTFGRCSHFRTQATGVGSTVDGVTFGINNTVIYFTFSQNSVSTYNLSDITSIKQFLAQQYSAGTPVTVWYVLSTPTTDIVNEPLMKIGDYADEVSGTSIPTTDGANTVSVDTTIQPSEVSINYHGWHMGAVHERTSGQWD